MADIAIFVSSMSTDGTDLTIGGEVRVAGSATALGFAAVVALGTSATLTNSAIKTAAIAAVTAADFTVGALDSKILFAGAAGI